MSEDFHAFRPVPKTGVIYVTSEATKLGFSPSDPDWCNLGQGQPETGELPGAPPRISALTIAADDQEYAPVAGLWELREAVAGHYNRTYRRGMRSQYSAENVCISGGGRAALTRAAASLGTINLGHFLPDYTAYEELLDIFKAFTSIPILLDGDQAYRFSAADLRREILGRGLSALLMSNPCNPTGKLVDDLGAWVGVARELDCALMLDEFYSHYVYGPEPMVSAARHVEDVDRDPIVLFDGFTKNWRYPGWRITWAVGPKAIIERFASAGSFLDGGGSKPLQRAAVPLFDAEYIAKETVAIQTTFRAKRDRMMARLTKLGVRFDRVPDGTFYCWGNVSELPAPLSDGMGLFRAALTKKVITVPGEFFDVNPGKRRPGNRGKRFSQFVRLSFGPALEEVELGLKRLRAMIPSL